ncbi:hypothetical protein [Citrobacter braakii]|jgi:hypothetical protein|uniref:hypothetical protein n=1 Tax=Citrobacter braakii TaxID=57706 RepID=UPI002A103C3C|nr:hypothetical protein [Citrobacter braakii]MDL4502771.1 hypothetical protein [Citrobacter braakii]
MSSREKFEQAIKSRFGDLIDYRVCKNSDGEYMAWDMQVAWWAWQAAETSMAVQLANAESKCRELAAENSRVKSVASNLVSKYIANKGTDCEFISCITPSKNTIGTGGVWDMWRQLDLVLQETPAIDAFLAEVQASARNEGINYAASRLAAAYNHGFIDKPLAEVSDVVRMILDAKDELANATIPPADGLSGEYAEKSLAEFAAQIRKGAAL